MKFRRFVGLLAITLAAMVPTESAYAQQARTAEQLVDAYFETAGGRDQWASAAGEYVLAVTTLPGAPLPYTFEFCWSFREPRTAERARFQGRTQLRGYESGVGWTFRKDSAAEQGQVRVWSAEESARNEAIWRGTFEVVLHRLARRDPALRVGMGQGPWAEWIEISEAGAPIGRLLLDDENTPRRYRRLADGAAVVFGPQAERGGINFAASGAFEIGASFQIIALELLSSEPRNVFAAPHTSHDGSLSCR